MSLNCIKQVNTNQKLIGVVSMKRTFKQESALILRQEKYNNRPSFTKKYVNDRNTSLSNFKRVIFYLTGTTKNYTKIEDRLKESQPEALKMRGKLVEWHFDTNKIWNEILMQDEYFKKVIKAKRIENYDELSIRAYSY